MDEVRFGQWKNDACLMNPNGDWENEADLLPDQDILRALEGQECHGEYLGRYGSHGIG